jgi:hypothetical protein
VLSSSVRVEVALVLSASWLAPMVVQVLLVSLISWTLLLGRPSSQPELKLPHLRFQLQTQEVDTQLLINITQTAFQTQLGNTFRDIHPPVTLGQVLQHHQLLQL